MSKTLRKNKWIKISTAISTLLSTSQAQAIDLQSKTKTVDKTDFNVISSPFKKPLGQYSIIGEVSDTKQPLILKQTNGKNQTLIDGLQAFELSFLYEMTDSLQLGILVPGEKPYGLIGPYNEAKSYLGNILIEPKVYISNDIALIPIYYVPTNNKLDLQISGTKETLDLGLNNGAYGLKVSMGKKYDNGIITAYQIGAIIAPESKFRDIDQSMRVQFGAGIKKEISGGLKLLAEAYGEKYKSNMPLEALAMIEYSNKNFMVRFGGGSGDIQGSGSNTTRLLANFAYYFGNEPKSGSAKMELSNTPVSEDDYKMFKKKVEKTEEQIRQEEAPLEMNLDTPTDTQQAPDQGSLGIKSIPLVTVQIEKQQPNELPFEKAQKIFLDTIDRIRDEDDLSFLKNMSDESFKRLFFQNMEGKNFGNTIQRTVASVTSNPDESSLLLEKIEKATVTPTAILEIQSKNYHWTEAKAKYVMMNLKRANASLKENIDLYAIYKSQNKSTTQVLNELNWGIRVFKRNLDSWNLLTSSYMEETGKSVDRLNLNTSVLLSNYFDPAISILSSNKMNLSTIANTKVNSEDNKTNQELKEAQEFVVKVITRLNVRKSPQILIGNVIGQLKNGDIVKSRSGKVTNEFIEVEVVKSDNLKTDHTPLYVNLKYLYPIYKKEETSIIQQNLSSLEDNNSPTAEDKAILENSLTINNPEEVLTQLNDVKTVLDDFSEVAKINGDLKAQENLEQIQAILNFDPMNVGEKKVADESTTSTTKIEESKTETEQKMIEIMDNAQSLPVEAPEQSLQEIVEEKVAPKIEEVTPTPTDIKPVLKKSLVLNSKTKAKKTKKVEVVETTDITNNTSTQTDSQSKIEIIYDEPAVVEVKNKKETVTKKKTLSKKTTNKLPEKTVEAIRVETIAPPPTSLTETPKAIEIKAAEDTKPATKVEVVDNTTPEEIKAPEAMVQTKEIDNSNPTEVKVVEVTPTPTDKPVVVDPKAEAKKKELDIIEQLIEMKSKAKKEEPKVQTKVEVVDNTKTQEAQTQPVEVPVQKKVEAKLKAETVFDQVLQQKNEEYLKSLEQKKLQPESQTPEQEDPLKMKTDGTTTYETGPSFDE